MKTWVDMHCHILPGMDDGSPDLAVSLEMARIACREGIGTVLCTPHNMPGKGRPTQAIVAEAVRRLQAVLLQEGLPLTLYPGCEHFYRSSVQEQAECGGLVTMNGTDCVLVEFDPAAERRYILNALQALSGEGYRPVLAHMERYQALREGGMETAAQLRRQGVLLQVNCGSLTGQAGLRTQWYVRALAKERLLDFVATDAHSAGRRAPRMEESARWLRRACGERYAAALLGQNARRLFSLDDAER